MCARGEEEIPIVNKQAQAAEKLSWDPSYLEDLASRQEKAKAGGGQKRIDAQHKKGKLTARERIEYLFDEGSFQEVGAFIESRFTEFGMKDKKLPGDGVITGFGTINGEPVYAAVEDFTVMGGTYGEYHRRFRARRSLSPSMTAAELVSKGGSPVSTAMEICFCGIPELPGKSRRSLL